MKFMGIAGHIHLDYKNNLGIVKELKTQPVMKFIENYRSDWKNHVL
jgi:hypothetical protein